MVNCVGSACLNVVFFFCSLVYHFSNMARISLRIRFGLRGVNETYASLLDGVFLSLLPPVQGFHIDAGDFAAVHGFDVSEVGIKWM